MNQQIVRTDFPETEFHVDFPAVSRNIITNHQITVLLLYETFDSIV